MAKVLVEAGICGHKTTIEGNSSDMMNIKLEITSTCSYIQKLAEELRRVEAIQEIGSLLGTQTYQKAAECIPHAACPVPSAIIKAIEVTAGLALPKDVIIKIEK